MRNNSKTKGEISEAVILARLLKLGFSVSIPFGNNQRYDFIIDDGKKLYRVQCKTGRMVNGCVSFMTCSKNGFTGKRTNYRNQIEFFMVYSPDTGLVYRIPVEKTAVTQMLLRVSPKKGGNFTKINWSKDYVF